MKRSPKIPLSTQRPLPGTRRLGLIGPPADRSCCSGSAVGRCNSDCPMATSSNVTAVTEDLHCRAARDRWRALWRMFADGESGFREGFSSMVTWSTPALYDLLELFACNDAALQRAAGSLTTSVLRSQLLHRLRSNSRRGGRTTTSPHITIWEIIFLLPGLTRG